MYSGESCTLGSINLAKFVDENREFNFNDFGKIVHLCTRFLNDVLEINKFPTKYIEEQSRKTNRIGLGIMGFADMLFKMRIRFNSQQAYDLVSMIGSSLYWSSIEESKELSKERGPCEAFQELVKSGTEPKEIVNRIYNENIFQSNDDVMQHLDKGVRNAWTTTIAPTGTISMIANCSNGLEPIFALVYKKIVSTGEYYYLNEEFRKALELEGLDNDEIVKKVEANNGSCQGITEIPQWIQETFVTAMDLHWTDHVVSQAIWQEHIDNSISKTINLPYNATANDIRYAYVLAHEIGLKGISVYRDGSRDKQVLHTNTSVKSNQGEIGAKAIINENVILKKSEPSEATFNYIKEKIQNEHVRNEFQVVVFKSAMQEQEFIKERKDCPFCNKGILVNMSGCESCNVCGQSTKCSIG
jgi:ribonucleoside-diphosphate reductase alpha chain